MKISKRTAAIGLTAGAIVVGFAVFRLVAPQASAQSHADNAAPTGATRMSSDELRFDEHASQLAMVKVDAVHASPIPIGEPLSGRLAYDEDATARVTMAISGRIVRLLAAPGDTVKTGQALAEIDSPDVGTALSDLAKARADEERKRLANDREKELLDAGVVARKDYESTEADLLQARAETARAGQRVRNLNPHQLRIQGETFLLASPIAGVVSERNANPAMEVNASLQAPLFVVTDPNRLWLYIDLPEHLLGKVQTGASISIQSDAYPDEQFKATIMQIGRIVDPATRRITVRARVDGGQARLRPEMFVRATILAGLGSAVRVPNNAIVSDGLYAYVFVQTGPGRFARRKVALAVRSGDYSYLSQGLQNDEHVVTSGALLLDAELHTDAGGRS